MRTKLALLDLEETLIPIWGEWWPIGKTEGISQALAEFKPNQVETFSWAIWGEEDKLTWKKNRHRVEDAIGWTFTNIRSIDDIMMDIKKLGRFGHFSREEFFDIFSRKETALFFLAFNGMWKHTDIILFDDTIVNSTTFIDDYDVSIRLVRV